MSSTDWEGSHSLDTAVSVAAVRPVVSSVKYPRWTTEDESCQLSPEQSNVNNVLWLLIGLGRTILPWRAIGLIFGRQQISVEVGHISKLIRDPSLRTVVSPPQPPPAGQALLQDEGGGGALGLHKGDSVCSSVLETLIVQKCPVGELAATSSHTRSSLTCPAGVTVEAITPLLNV